MGRTHIEPGKTRRIILQQRLRVQPDDDGLFVFETIAPSPLLITPAGGRVSVVVLLPYEDADVHVQLDDAKTEHGYAYELGQIKQRKVVSWAWQNDPVLRLGYRYF